MMKNTELLKLREKLFFSCKDVADILDIKPESAWVLCSRYVKKGVFIRLKNNFYVLEQNWQGLPLQEFLKISNFLQVPSYISFMTALSFYEITTQVQRNFFESASLRQSKKIDVKGAVFNFYKLKEQYYFDFIKKDSVFIATKEKAFVDSVYLYSFGKYKFDFSSIGLNKLNKNRVKDIVSIFPQKTKAAVKKLCGI